MRERAWNKIPRHHLEALAGAKALGRRGQVAVALLAAMYADFNATGGAARVNVKEVARITGVRERTVRRVLAELLAADILSAEKGHPAQPTKYALTLAACRPRQSVAGDTLPVADDTLGGHARQGQGGGGDTLDPVAGDTPIEKEENGELLENGQGDRKLLTEHWAEVERIRQSSEEHKQLHDLGLSHPTTNGFAPAIGVSA